MSFLGGALSTLEPSERVRQALTRDLELRRSDERLLTRFSGYAYRGGADLILQHGRFYSGRTIPAQYVSMRGPESDCFINALRACMQDPALRYCEGYVTAGFGTPIVHGWCVAPDNGVVEVTLPTLPEELDRYFNALRLPFVNPVRWGYYGATFTTELVDAHGSDEALGLPMLDRSPAELADAESRELAARGVDMSEPHGFPILKVRYDPNRTEVP